jgi:HTH-type transcriptional regulator/antitoxin HipB
VRLQEFGYLIRKARRARTLSQAEVARTAGLSRTTINQLENGVFPDIGMRKAQAILEGLGLDLHVRPGPRQRRPDFVAMACTTASVSYREDLTEPELVRMLLTGRVPRSRRAHLATLLEEAPAALLKGMVHDIERWTEPGRVTRNLLVIAESLGLSRRTKSWLTPG